MLETMDTKKSNTQSKVLLTEDDPMASYVHAKYLQDMGFEVECAGDGQQAWERYLSDYATYSLIILDGSMPGMDGIDLAKQIRAHEKGSGLPRMPLLLISAHPHQLVEKWCQEADIDGFEIKPVKPEDLKSLIVRCLSKKID